MGGGLIGSPPIFGPDTPPLNLGGGYCFPNAPGREEVLGEPLCVKAANGTYSVIGAETGEVFKTGLSSPADAAAWVYGYHAHRFLAARAKPRRAGSVN